MVGDPDKTILCVSENGYGKKTALEDFPSHNRGGQGVISMKTSERNGSMVSAALVEDEDGIMLISDKGTMIRTTVSQVPTSKSEILKVSKSLLQKMVKNSLSV